MLRITVHKDAQTITLQLEGRLAAPWLEELDESFQRSVAGESGPKVAVDLTGLISIDRAGRTYLEAMHQQGVQFTVGDCETKSIIDEIAGSAAAGRRQPKQNANL
jgi:anti-anti-sigma regulatory factor